MTTLSYVSTKGGVGKSTLTWITASSLANDFGKKRLSKKAVSFFMQQSKIWFHFALPLNRLNYFGRDLMNITP
jgi:hypothetical protein